MREMTLVNLCASGPSSNIIKLSYNYSLFYFNFILLLLLYLSLPDLTLATGKNKGSDDPLMTHKYRGSIVVLSISKSVKPNEEQKEMISGFQ